MTGHGITGTADAGAFLARLVRLDPQAPVRLRPVGATGRTVLWARLPWDVLVARTVTGTPPGDVTVAARELLAELAAGGVRLPDRRDTGWRWPLPPRTAQAVESVPVAELHRLAAAAAGTLRAAADDGINGRAVGQRMLRDALLDHVAIVVTGGATGRVEISQRLVQGAARMGFLGPPTAPGGSPVDGGAVAERNPALETAVVRQAGRWTGLIAPFGSVWSLKTVPLTLITKSDQPNG